MQKNILILFILVLATFTWCSSIEKEKNKNVEIIQDLNSNTKNSKRFVVNDDVKNKIKEVKIDDFIFSSLPKIINEPFTEDDKVYLDDWTHIPAKKNQILIYLNRDITFTELDNVLLKIKIMGGSVIGTNPELMILQVKIIDELNSIKKIKKEKGILNASLNVELKYSYSN